MSLNKSNNIASLIDILGSEHITKRKLARANFKDFIDFVKPDYEFSKFHDIFISELDDFYKGNISKSKKMVSIPPQHGKSELSSRLGPAFLLGLNPSLKIGLLSYTAVIAQGFSKNIQSIISSTAYRELFPKTIIDGVGCKSGTLIRNSYEFHTSEGGYVVSVGVGGALTSKTIDILIIDDLYKSNVDAWSETHRDKIESWYWSVAETRLHNDSKVMMVFTRWHNKDLAGKMLEDEEEKLLWDETKYEIIKTGVLDNPKDTREIGEALWEEKHSLESARRWEKRDPISFRALGQQDPTPVEGLLYKGFNTYPSSMLSTLNEKAIVESYTDTADTGDDSLTAFIFYLYKDEAYIKDIIHTQDDMSITIDLWAKTIATNKVTNSIIEYNNGGHPFALYAKDKLHNKYDYKWSNIYGFHQSQNKVARIISNAGWVQEHIYFPENWHILWPKVYKHLHEYMKNGKNAHDDIEDALTGVAEMVTQKHGKLSETANPF